MCCPKHAMLTRMAVLSHNLVGLEGSVRIQSKRHRMALSIARWIMLRFRLFMVAALMAAASVVGVVNAQVGNDPAAAAPVTYSGVSTAASPTTISGCDSGVYNADGSPVISCNANTAQQVEDGGANAATDSADVYAEDYSADDAPAYFGSNFYPGVSLLPYDYWYPGFAFGWPYYGFASFGYGFGYAFAPYSYFAFGCCEHRGHYHGPYRYVGHGRYWDQRRYASTSALRSATYANHRVAGTAFNTASTSVVNRANAARAGAVTSGRAAFAGTPASQSRSASLASNGRAGAANAVRRAALPSASYYAATRSGSVPSPTSAAISSARATAGNRVSSVGGRSVNPRGANQSYWVTSLPSRGYAASSYSSSNGNRARSYNSPVSRGYATPRASYAMPQQRYSSPPRSYSAARSVMPSYSRGGSGVATHSSGASSAHSSGGGHAGADYSRGH